MEEKKKQYIIKIKYKDVNEDDRIISIIVSEEIYYVYMQPIWAEKSISNEQNVVEALKAFVVKKIVLYVNIKMKAEYFL